MLTNKKIIFFTAEKGQDLPGAKRCHIIAEKLKMTNYTTSVISSADYLGTNFDGRPNDIQKIISQIKIYNKIRNEKETIFYIQRIDYHVIAPLLASKINFNQIIIDIDDWALDANIFRGLSIMKFLRIEKILGDILKRSDGCIVLNQKLKTLIEGKVKNIIVVPPLVEWASCGKQDDSKNKQEFIFCWIGTIYREDDLENISFLINSFKKFKNKLKNNYPDKLVSKVYLDIVGGGPLFSKLENSIKKTDTRLKVWMPAKELDKYLKNIDVGLIPLIQNINYNIYKTPTKLFDFIRFSKPVIVSDVGETGFFVKQNNVGISVDNNPINWAGAFMELYINYQKKYEISGAACQILKEKYSLQKSINNINTLITNL